MVREGVVCGVWFLPDGKRGRAGVRGGTCPHLSREQIWGGEAACPSPLPAPAREGHRWPRFTLGTRSVSMTTGFPILVENCSPGLGSGGGGEAGQGPRSEQEAGAHPWVCPPSGRGSLQQGLRGPGHSSGRGRVYDTPAPHRRCQAPPRSVLPRTLSRRWRQGSSAISECNGARET